MGTCRLADAFYPKKFRTLSLKQIVSEQAVRNKTDLSFTVFKFVTLQVQRSNKWFSAHCLSDITFEQTIESSELNQLCGELSNRFYS